VNSEQVGLESLAEAGERLGHPDMSRELIPPLRRQTLKGLERQVERRQHPAGLQNPNRWPHGEAERGLISHAVMRGDRPASPVPHLNVPFWFCLFLFIELRAVVTLTCRCMCNLFLL